MAKSKQGTNKAQKKAYLGNTVKFLLGISLFTLIVVFLLSQAYGQPTGVVISGNVTETAGTTLPAPRTDEGGTITTLVMDVLQQNPRWKAYVGNMTGALTLDDSSGQTIFRWSLGAEDLTGELYVSRSNTVSWGDIDCANETVIINEDTSMGFSASAVDTINRTFNETEHPALSVGIIPITGDTCRSMSTYVNSTAQTQANADFPAILLASNLDVVYVSPLNQGSQSYNNETLVDFQVIVPDVSGAGITTYYFYAQVGS